jgi:cysteine desulfurase/selenocysteine lyase
MSIPPLTEISPGHLTAPGHSAPATPGGARPFDVERAREDFPILRQKVHGKPLVYLDNSATTQKPQVVLDCLRRYYSADNANIHRAVHQLSERATRAYEEARHKVRDFLGAASTREVVFVRGATEGINLVAQSWGRTFLRPGDEIVISAIEHHSNIVPWQMLCQQTGAVLRVIGVDDAGELLMDEYERLLSERTRLVSVVHLSNSLGTINPVEKVIELAHAKGARVLIDAAQSISHLKIDVRELDCDFLVFSGHKLYGPTGIGVLYGKEELLEAMPPWQGGGDMIASVTFAKTTYADLPSKFEAGTPHIAGVIGLGTAIDYVRGIGIEAIAAHEQALLRRATERLRHIHGVRVVGQAEHKAAVLSFVVDEPPLSALDVGTRLDLEGIAVRTGHHCCQPVMDRYGIPGTVRASFALYNTLAEVDAFADALARIVESARRTHALALAEQEQRCPGQGDLCGSVGHTCPPKRELAYAEPIAETPEAAAEEIAENFELLDDWSDRYEYLLGLGKKLPMMPDELKTECTRVHGCQSTVYLAARQKPGTQDVLEFLADSDAELVRGLIGLLEHLFSGQRSRDILAFDVEGFFRRLGLDQHLTLGRRNGLAAMVKRIRQQAAGLAGS